VTQKYEPFIIETVSGNADRITATASYGDYREERESHLPMSIEGVLANDCSFWPRITAEVSNDVATGWRSVESPKNLGEPATAVFERNSPNIWLHLDLTVFRQMIGKSRYGKVTLMNGASAVFELKNLLPPGPPQAWAEVVKLPPGDPLHNLPFAVAEFESMGEDLRAVCEYLDMQASSRTSIEGTETPDGEFWPYVTAQVANNYRGVWRVIGHPSNVGKPTSLSIKPKDVNARLIVDMEIFRPLIGKFRYGRLVLKNGKAAIFELKNLLPPEQGDDTGTGSTRS
jgi:hypothetical protein